MRITTIEREGDSRSQVYNQVPSIISPLDIARQDTATFWNTKIGNDMLEIFIFTAGWLTSDEILHDNPPGAIPSRVSPHRSTYFPKLLNLGVCQTHPSMTPHRPLAVFVQVA